MLIWKNIFSFPTSADEVNDEDNKKETGKCTFSWYNEPKHTCYSLLVWYAMIQLRFTITSDVK